MSIYKVRLIQVESTTFLMCESLGKLGIVGTLDFFGGGSCSGLKLWDELYGYWKKNVKRK